MDEAKGSNGRTGAAKKAALVSNEEMDAAMLRIVKDRSEAKRTRAALENHLRMAGRALIELGSPLIVASGTDSAQTANTTQMQRWKTFAIWAPRSVGMNTSSRVSV